MIVNENSGKIRTFSEHDVTITGEESHLLEFANSVTEGEFSTLFNDLAYKILCELDADFYKAVSDED